MPLGLSAEGRREGGRSSRTRKICCVSAQLLEETDGLRGRRTFDVEGTGERAAVLGPATTVGEEEFGLDGAGRGVGVCEVVPAAEDARLRRRLVVGGEGRVLVGCRNAVSMSPGLLGRRRGRTVTLGSLDERERHAFRLGGGEVDGALVMRNVEALGLRRTGLEGRRGGDRGCCESEEGCDGELHVERLVSREERCRPMLYEHDEERLLYQRMASSSFRPQGV